MSNNPQSSSTSFIIPPVIAPKVEFDAPFPQGASASGENQSQGHEPSAENVSMLSRVLGTYSSTEQSIMKTTNIAEHKYPRLFFRLSLICTLLMILLFVIWMFFTPYGYPWFIHPFHLIGILFSIFYVAGSADSSIGKKIFTVHTSFVVMTIGVFVIANLSVRGFPWFIFPSAFFLTVYCIHALYHKLYSQFNPLSVHCILFLVCNMVFFVWYCYGSVRFPWNLPILAVWSVLFIVHLVLHIMFWRRIVDKWNSMRGSHNHGAAPTSTSFSDHGAPSMSLPQHHHHLDVVEQSRFHQEEEEHEPSSQFDNIEPLDHPSFQSTASAYMNTSSSNDTRAQADSTGNTAHIYPEYTSV